MDSTLKAATIGMRVGVFHSCTKDTLLLFGYGVYEADEVPPEGIFGPSGTWWKKFYIRPWKIFILIF